MMYARFFFFYLFTAWLDLVVATDEDEQQRPTRTNYDAILPATTSVVSDKLPAKMMRTTTTTSRRNLSFLLLPSRKCGGAPRRVANDEASKAISDNTSLFGRS
jgi:hypothetical protein